MTTSEADIRPYNSQSDSYNLKHDVFEELAVQDLAWVVNGQSKYASMLHKLPDILAWEESADHHANLHILERSVALRRLYSSLKHIGRYDEKLFRSMLSTFEELPTEGRLRFMTAPETFYRIRRLRKEPVDSIISLCNFLNGEAALHGLGPIDKGYVTALGDFYYSEAVQGRSAGADGKEDVSAANAVHTPRLAGVIPIDFASPNAAAAQETKEIIQYIQYSEEEKALVCERLNDVFSRIERVSEAAARLIKEYVKVIIPLKTPEPYSSGSTSQSRYPGRILLRGAHVGSTGALASGMVHEAMHQVLYMLEWIGPFITDDADARDARAQSGWTGRDLPLHSYIHACFIWYGLANFWGRARSSEAFAAADVSRQLQRSLMGFRDHNPVERLAPFPGMVRYDILKTAGTLRDRLQDLMSEVEDQPVGSDS